MRDMAEDNKDGVWRTDNKAKRVEHCDLLTRSKKQSNNNEKIQNIPANFPEHPESVIPLEDDFEREDGENALVKNTEPKTVLLCLETKIKLTNVDDTN